MEDVSPRKLAQSLTEAVLWLHSTLRESPCSSFRSASGRCHAHDTEGLPPAQDQHFISPKRRETKERRVHSAWRAAVPGKSSKAEGAKEVHLVLREDILLACQEYCGPLLSVASTSGPDFRTIPPEPTKEETFQVPGDAGGAKNPSHHAAQA